MRLGLVNLLVVDNSLLLPTLKAGVDSLFSALVGLACHGSLVGCELIAADDEAVDRDDHAVPEMDNVTNMQIVDMERCWLDLSILVRSQNLHLIISNKVC